MNAPIGRINRVAVVRNATVSLDFPNVSAMSAYTSTTMK